MQQKDHINLFFTGQNLKETDLLRKSVLFLKLYLIDNKKRYLLGQTEPQQNIQCFTWTTPIQIEYIFQKKQKLEFEIYDKDITNDDLIAKGKCKLGQIMVDRANKFEVQLKSKDGKKDQ
ncbi:hypothetical protein IMG5_170790, partial [Ichthyophthirius multifiliis]